MLLPKVLKIFYFPAWQMANLDRRVRLEHFLPKGLEKGGEAVSHFLPLFLLEVEWFLRNPGSQFLFWRNHATRKGGSIPEESWFTIPFLGESCHLSSFLPASIELRVSKILLSSVPLGLLNLCRWWGQSAFFKWKTVRQNWGCRIVSLMGRELSSTLKNSINSWPS